MFRRKMTRLVIGFIVLCLLVAGCYPTPEKTRPHRFLKVMYFGENSFYEDYGDLFLSKYGDVDLEVAVLDSSTFDPTKNYSEALREFIQRENPDVFYLSSQEYERFVRKGLLASLEPHIKADHYELSGMQDTIIDFLRELGGGQIYGLSPTFYSTALYYNADLFKQYGIDPPHDNMTWQEILDLAGRFPVDGGKQQRVYGLSVPFVQTVDSLAERIAGTDGLSAVNPETMQVTLNTDSWRNVWEMAITGVRSSAIYLPDTPFYGGSLQDYLDNDLFLQGRVAMKLDDASLLETLGSLTNTMPKYKAFSFDTVTGPVDPADRSASRDVEVGQIFAIRSGTPNPEAAWDFVKYVNSEEFAAIKARVVGSSLLTRNHHYNENRVEAFYRLRPLKVDYSREAKLPDSFKEKFKDLLSNEMGKVVRRESDLKEALERISEKGQMLLDQAVGAEELREVSRQPASVHHSSVFSRKKYFVIKEALSELFQHTTIKSLVDK
ncbi:ABC transporter substrate-binding protein [Paenibacillus sanfengchensis]|uniref:ABC transporter substrate-binding protein n=1 Tax=Paenibacillus sanfengchensis TaxID=3119819 RepID=UPI002FE365A1